MAFLMGVLLAFGRLASDSEIVALRASGISPARLLRPVVALSLARRPPHLLHRGGGPARGQPGLPRDHLLAHRQQGPHRRDPARLQRRPASRRQHGAVRVRHPRRDRRVAGHLHLRHREPAAAASGSWPARGRLDIDRERKKVELDLRSGVIYTFNSAVAGADRRGPLRQPASSPSPSTSSSPRSRWPRATGR